jgi:hypothetical protein
MASGQSQYYPGMFDGINEWRYIHQTQFLPTQRKMLAMEMSSKDLENV